MGPRAGYLFSEIGVGLRRNLLMTVATVVTVTVSLALLGVGLLVQRQVDDARAAFFSQVEVAIYLVDGISETQRTTLEGDLREHPVVETVDYESKEEAFATFQELFAESESLLASVTPEMLPASFRIQLANAEEYAVVESAFAGYPGVDDVTDQQDVLDNLFLILNNMKFGAWGIAAIQVIGAAALIFNTIRVTAFARREQTAIMKLVGATNWYIRLPFLLEGMIAGLIGALLASGLLILTAGPLLNRMREQILFLPIIGVEDALRIMPILVLGGVSVAAVASFLSLRRFLAV